MATPRDALPTPQSGQPGQGVGSSSFQAKRVPAPDQAPEIRLRGERVTLPITMVREYPFVEGAIAGVPGKLMLDTGAMPALIVNDHRVPLVGGVAMGSGHFGSGQTFAVRLNAHVGPVRIAQLRFDHASQVTSQNASQLEAITPDYIGWIGYSFWNGYALKLDYRRLQVTFFKGGPEQFLQDESVVADLPFETRRLANHPLMAGSVGGVPVVAAFDTGQYGTLYTTSETKARLIAQGTLRPSAKGNGTFNLRTLVLDGRELPGIDGIEVETDPAPAAGPLGLTEPNVLSIGFGLLQRYTSVWDYPRHHLYLLAPR